MYKIRWEGEERRTSYSNHRGPVVEDIFDEFYYKYSYPLPLKYRINHTITVSAAIYHPDSTSLKGMIELTFSTDSAAFFKFGAQIKSPNIDSVYINSTGGFGYSAVGRNPTRKVYEVSGFMKDGTVSTYDMTGFLEENPSLHNPKKGYLALCNNKFAPDQYTHRGSLHEITTGRAYRLNRIITEKIAAGHKFSFEDMKTMQLDFRDEFLSEAFPYVLTRL